MHGELFTELKKDHREVLKLLNRLMETTRGADRHRLVETLLKEILPHMIGEEQIVYPALRTDTDAWEDARLSLRQHHAAQDLMEDLASTSPDDERFASKVQRLKQEIEAHMREEEDTIFGDLRRVVDERDVKHLLDSFRREKNLARAKYPDLPIRTDKEGEIRV